MSLLCKPKRWIACKGFTYKGFTYKVLVSHTAKQKLLSAAKKKSSSATAELSPAKSSSKGVFRCVLHNNIEFLLLPPTYIHLYTHSQHYESCDVISHIQKWVRSTFAIPFIDTRTCNAHKCTVHSRKVESISGTKKYTCMLAL